MAKAVLLSAYLLRSHPEHSLRLRTLYEFVYESVNIGELSAIMKIDLAEISATKL
jgi:hypothetical protein